MGSLSTGLPELDRAIYSLICTGLVALATRLYQARVQLRYFAAHVFTFNVPVPDQKRLLVYTRSLRIENFGRAKASNVEIHHAYRANNIAIFPPHDYLEITNPEGFHLIRIPSLGPKEGCSIEMLSTSELPIFVQARSDAGPARAANSPFSAVHRCRVFVCLFTRDGVRRNLAKPNSERAISPDLGKSSVVKTAFGITGDADVLHVSVSLVFTFPDREI